MDKFKPMPHDAAFVKKAKGKPDVQAAYKTVETACRNNGKVLGMGGVYDRDWATRYTRENGARLVLSGSDHSYFVAGAKQRSEFPIHCATRGPSWTGAWFMPPSGSP